jgi:hypothetical protein
MQHGRHVRVVAAEQALARGEGAAVGVDRLGRTVEVEQGDADVELAARGVRVVSGFRGRLPPR